MGDPTTLTVDVISFVTLSLGFKKLTLLILDKSAAGKAPRIFVIQYCNAADWPIFSIHSALIITLQVLSWGKFFQSINKSNSPFSISVLAIKLLSLFTIIF